MLIKIIQRYHISLCALLLASMLSITVHITGMENPLEQNKKHQAPPTGFMALPDEIPSMIIAASKNQQALSATCTYLRDFITKNKETMLKQGLLELNGKALDKFLLHYGAAGNGIIAGNLLAKGANPNACRVVCQENRLDSSLEFRQKPLIFDAIKNGHTNIVKLLIAHGVDIKLKYQRGQTPLHCACKHKNPSIVKMLLIHEADINEKDHYSNTPLHFAAASGNSEIVAILLDNEVADVNAKDAFGVTPLHTACGSENTKIIVQLLQKGARLNEKDNKGYTTLHHGYEHSNMIEFLVMEKDADINARDNDNSTPLHKASQYGYTQGVKTLLDLGALVDARNSQNETPLHLACSFGRVEVVKILLDNGADIHAIGGIYDSSPLHYASEYRKIETIKMLLDRGARVNQKDRNGRTPLSWATYKSKTLNNNEEVKKFLIAHGGETSGFLLDNPWVQPIGFVVTLGAIAFSVYSLRTRR